MPDYSTHPNYSEILYDVDGPVLTITLNRPDKLNAFTFTMMKELLDAFDQADADDDVRAVIITGAGRGFCAGADLAAGDGTFDYRDSSGAEARLEDARDGGGLVTLRIFESKKPVIAAVNGPAVGVGVTMTLAMDVRMASDQARFGFVFARRGLVPEAASSWFLPRIVGIGQAMEWVMTGRVFPAGEALAGRLVRSVHPPDELLPAARALALEVAENTSPTSVALSRQMLWRMLGADHPMEAHKVDSRIIWERGRTADAREGVLSFLEKRPAEFSMKVSSDMGSFFPWWQERKFE